MDSLINQMIGRYHIVDELGRGGMAVVYKARDTTLDRFVAIKLILPGQQQTDRFLKRFIREAKALAQLSHPNIVKILDYGEYEGSPYLVMEYIPAGSLMSKMGQPISASESAGILLPITYALQHAHEHKIIHRDVKPQNILINESGQPMLADFGIIKLMDTDESQSLTGAGAMVGTPSYMSPEQIKGRQVDGRTDVYALGIIFFEMVTGRKPYVANTPVEVTIKQINEPIPKPRLIIRDLPQDAEQLIYKSLAKNPEDRYADMEALATVLAKIAGKKYAPPRQKAKAEPEPNLPTQKRKLPLPALLIGAAVIVFAVIGGVIWYSRSNPAQVASTNPTPTTVATEVVTETPIIPTETATIEVTATTAPTSAPTVTAAVEATPTGQAAAPVSGKVLADSNLSNIVELGRIEKVSVIQLDWAPDGKSVVDAGAKYIYLIDPKIMKTTGLIELGNDIPKAICLTSDSQKAYVLIGNDIRLYDLNSRAVLKTFPAPAGTNSMALSQDDKILAVGVLNNKVQLINAQDGSVVRTMRSNFGGWSVAFSPNSALVASGTTNGSLMWETQTGIWKQLLGGQSDLIKSLVFSKDGTLVAGGSDGKIILWETATGKMQEYRGDFKSVNSLDFSPDGKLLVSGNDDFTVRIFKINAGVISDGRILKSHSSSVLTTHFSPNGENIISGAVEGVIRLWGLP